MDQIVLVQCSDAHFQSRFDSPGDGFVDGWRSHSLTLCRGFQAAIRQVRLDLRLQKTKAVYFLMCGDLSSFGSHGNFSAGHAFFRGRRPINLDYPGVTVGLALPDDLLRMVPGNHDHWKGRPLPVQKRYNTNLFPTQFRTTPWWDHTIVDGSLCIDLFGIDSNSDMRERIVGGRWDTTLARGKVSQYELQHLDTHLEAAANLKDIPYRVRLVMVHHSFTVPPQLFDAQQLERGSADTLINLARKHAVSGFLTGHVHTSNVSLLATPEPGQGQRACWEIRSATTLQGPERFQDENGFFVHQFSVEGLAVRWRLWQYTWAPSAGKFANVMGQGPLAEL